MRNSSGLPDKLRRLIDLQRRLHLARDQQRPARRLTTQRVRRLIQIEVGLSRVNRLADSYALRLLADCRRVGL